MDLIVKDDFHLMLSLAQFLGLQLMEELERESIRDC